MFRKILLISVMLSACNLLFAQGEIVVAQDGSGDFTTIQKAISSLPADGKSQRVIFIKKGIYKEKIFIDKDFITLKGENRENTIVNISLAREEWRCDNPDDYGTAAINLRGSDITLENLSFINSYGKDNTKDKTITCPNDSGKQKIIRPNVHQMALRSFETTRLIVKNCIFRAYGGDTVSPWNTDAGMFYFKDCIMEGGVDFYCPRGWAIAENCTFICHNNNAAIWHDGSKYESSKTVLINCKFTGDDGFKLGRYHRDAQFYLINCSFPKNMADADIYLVPTTNTILWGRRVYYYNCKREGGDFAWHKNNLPAAINVNDITPAWAFDNNWDPVNAATARVDELATVAAAEEDRPAANPSTPAKLVLPKKENTIKDPVAENMLLYQRGNGGWPKHFQAKNVDYKHELTEAERNELRSGHTAGMDATIDNEATVKEIKYLVKIYKQTKNKTYLDAAEKGIDYLLKAQYPNGGWPQFYPDFSSYKSQVTYNDNAMVNVLNVMQDVVKGKNDFDVISDVYVGICQHAVEKGISCILKTQLKQNGKLTAWCAQYDAKSLEPAMARKFELVSLSGSESVGIVRFLMRIENPSKEIIMAVNSAIEWFNKVKLTGYKYVDVAAPAEASKKDRVLQPDPKGILWARFYDINTNEPFFAGRDSEKKKTIAEVENERRIGYAWYGAWALKLITTEYPAWKLKWRI